MQKQKTILMIFALILALNSAGCEPFWDELDDDEGMASYLLMVEKTATMKTVMAYNDMGYLTSAKTTDSNGQMQMSYIYTYDHQGQRTTIKYTEYVAGSESYLSTTTYSYEDGLLISKLIIYGVVGSMETAVIYTYQYDSEDRLLSELNEATQDKPSEWTYNSNDQITSYNDMTNTTLWEYTYNDEALSSYLARDTTTGMADTYAMTKDSDGNWQLNRTTINGLLTIYYKKLAINLLWAGESAAEKSMGLNTATQSRQNNGLANDLDEVARNLYGHYCTLDFNSTVHIDLPSSQTCVKDNVYTMTEYTWEKR